MSVADRGALGQVVDGTDVRTAHRQDIDGLRGLSVLLVVAFHALPTIAPGGFVGVDVFFVISGYLITQIIVGDLVAERFRIGGFYARRIRRIFPALAVVLAASLAFGWFALLGDEYASLGKHVGGGAGFVSNLVLLNETGYFDTFSHLKPMLHLWSLGIEEQFYLAYPLLLALIWRWRNLVPWILGAMLVASFWGDAARIAHSPDAAFYLPHLRGWELFAGGLLAMMEVRSGGDVGASLRTWLAGAGLAGISLAAWSFDRHTVFPGVAAMLPVMGAVALIAAGPNNPVSRFAMSQPMLTWFGRISYPFYLWHWPLLSFAYIAGPELLPRSLRIGLVAMAILLAWLTYRLVEKPLRFGGNGRAKVLGLLVSVAALGMTGLLVLRDDGMQQRLPEAMRVASAPEPAPCRPTDPPGATCYGDDGARSEILLLGDSHGLALEPGLATLVEARRDLRLVVVARALCMPLYGVRSSDPGGSDRKCAALFESAFRHAAKGGEVRTVVLAARWASRVGQARGFREKGGDDARGEYRFAGQAEAGGNDAAFVLGLQHSLGALEKVPRIVFVHQVPELGMDPRRCASRPLLDAPRIAAEDCAVAIDDVAARQEEYRRLAAPVLSGFPRVEQFEPAALLCDSTNCRALADGKLMYRDDDHVNGNGALVLARGLLGPRPASPDSAALASVRR